MKNISYKVALGGIVSALCLLCMFLAGIIPIIYILMPMAAGVLLMIIATEVSVSWAWLTYASVSLLSLFVTADKEAALVFIMVFGHYPILRFHMRNMKLKRLRYLLKMAIFNVCVVGFFYVTVFLFGLDQMLTEMNEYGKYGGILMLALANVMFVLYDFNLEAAYVIYRSRFMPRLRRDR